MTATRTREELFQARVEVRPDGCWQWHGAMGRRGYGLFQDGKLRIAHRWAYEHWVGPIPDGLVLDHLCRNTSCVNPTHLDPCTQRENLRRSDLVTGLRSMKTHCPRGHPYDAANTIRRDGRRYCRTCRDHYHGKKTQ